MSHKEMSVDAFGWRWGFCRCCAAGVNFLAHIVIRWHNANSLQSVCGVGS